MTAGAPRFLVDRGRGVLMRVAPAVDVRELHRLSGVDTGRVGISVSPDDRPYNTPSLSMSTTISVTLTGDPVPCRAPDNLACETNALVHKAIRKDLVERMPAQRIRDILDYHSSVEQAAAAAARAGVDTLVLTHYEPPPAPGDEDTWRVLAATEFDGRMELGEDLLHITVR